MVLLLLLLFRFQERIFRFALFCLRMDCISFQEDLCQILIKISCIIVLT